MAPTAPTAEHATAARVAELIELDDRAFDRVVNLEIRGRSDDATRQALRSPQVIERFYAEVIATSSQIASDINRRRLEVEAAEQRADIAGDRGEDRFHVEQLADKAADLRLEFTEWLRSVTGVKAAADKLALRVKVLRDDALRDKVHPETVDRLRRRVAKLEEAVRTHRAGVDDDEATPADRRLWDTVKAEP